VKQWLELVSTLRLTRKRFAHLLLGVGVTLNAGLTYTPVSADVVATDKSALQDKPAATLVELPHTDGDGLLPKPPAFTKEESAQLLAASRHACEGPCVTPFGTVLGAADGAESSSNCVSTCVRPEYSFLDLRSGEVSVYPQNPNQPNLQYIGITYQCVEYVRKWWMKNKGITFGSIDSAHEILYFTEGTNIRTQEPIPLARSLNGTAHRLPKPVDYTYLDPWNSRPHLVR
jgi:hypothetical protein